MNFFEIRAEHEAKNDCFDCYNLDMGQFVKATNPQSRRQIDPAPLMGKMLWKSTTPQIKVDTEADSAEEMKRIQNRERGERAARLASLFTPSVEDQELSVAELIEAPKFL